ncbi:MAG: DR2241 family protein [Alphaproteobacteria bacterium]
MANRIERIHGTTLTVPFQLGQILVRKTESGVFFVSHRDDQSLAEPETFRHAEDAIEIARYDDAGNYRPLKTAPNLRHGWLLQLGTIDQVSRALDYFYPGRLAVFFAWKTGRLKTTPLRETLDRQSGMYRVAAKISDARINDVVANFCRADGGCLRTILWNRDENGAIASTKLPKEKFDPSFDQVAPSNSPGSSSPATTETATIPLLCQESCNLLVAECRKVVKAE